MPTKSCKVCGRSFYHRPCRSERATYCSRACKDASQVGRRSAVETEFKPGAPSEKRLPVGTVTIRTRAKRGGVRRAWVKVADPNVWNERAVVVWERANGPLSDGMVVHHKDEDPLNDALENLCAITRSEHAKIHRPNRW